MPKLILSILPFLFINSFVIGQSDFNEPEKSNSFRIGAFYSIDKNLSPTNFDKSEYIGYKADYDQINYKTGLNVEFKVNNNFSLITGVVYSNKDFTGTFYCAVCNIIGPILPEKIDLQYIEIPLTVRYYFLSAKFRIFGEAGFINQFIIKSEIVEKSYVLSGKVGGGIEYNFTKVFSVQLSTEYTKGVSGLYKDSDFRSKILGFSLEIIVSI